MATPVRPPARSTDPADYQDVPRPVAAMAKDFADGHHIVPHRHRRAQFIFAAQGAMLVSTREGTWAVPPHRAVWMPAGVTHEIRMAGDVAMRTLYVRADAAARLAPAVRVLAVSPLLREMILRACALPVLYDATSAAGRLMTLILDEIAALPTVALDLPMPRDARLGRICRALSAEPGATDTLSDWGRRVGASPRTLARLFVRQTGLTFAAWRQQARLLAATAMLAAGEPITRIALDLGYESPSAFTAMFKRALGAPPSHYLGAEAGGRPSLPGAGSSPGRGTRGRRARRSARAASRG
jgi:AraC-like DNA-binding protein/quercetin dioxygenase-like cupin family protein